MSVFNQQYGHQCYNTHDEWLALFADSDLRTTASFGLLLKLFSTPQLDMLDLPDDVYSALSRVASDLPSHSNACLYILER